MVCWVTIVIPFQKYYFSRRMDTKGTESRSHALKLTKAAGWAAFMFFLVKGLMWLVVPAIVAYLSFKD